MLQSCATLRSHRSGALLSRLAAKFCILIVAPDLGYHETTIRGLSSLAGRPQVQARCIMNRSKSQNITGMSLSFMKRTESLDLIHARASDPANSCTASPGSIAAAHLEIAV